MATGSLDERGGRRNCTATVNGEKGGSGTAQFRKIDMDARASEANAMPVVAWSTRRPVTGPGREEDVLS